jgi:hypothetical protein
VPVGEEGVCGNQRCHALPRMSLHVLSSPAARLPAWLLLMRRPLRKNAAPGTLLGGVDSTLMRGPADASSTGVGATL